MALIDVVRKPSTLKAFQLTSSADMTTALEYLSSRGYDGSMSLTRINNVNVWKITLQAASAAGVQTAAAFQSGVIGDWIVIENDVIATIVVAAQKLLPSTSQPRR